MALPAEKGIFKAISQSGGEKPPAATFDSELRRHKSSQKALVETSVHPEVIFCAVVFSGNGKYIFS